MGLSVRNSARQVGHQVAKYIIKTGRPAAARSAEVSSLPSTRCMAKAGGISPTLVPCGADGGGGGGVAGGGGVSAGGGVAAAADGIAVGGAAAATAAVAAAVGGCGVLAPSAGGVAGCGVSVSVGDGTVVAAADAGDGVDGMAIVGTMAGGTGVSGGTAAAAVTMDAGSDATMVTAVVAAASAVVAAGGGDAGCWQPASSAPAAMPTASNLMIGLGISIILRSVHDAGGYPHQLCSCRSCWRCSLCCWASDGAGAALGFADSKSR